MQMTKIITQHFDGIVGKKLILFLGGSSPLYCSTLYTMVRWFVLAPVAVGVKLGFKLDLQGTREAPFW